MRHLFPLAVAYFALVGCDESPTDPLQTPSLPDSILERRILVDASRDDGAWWFPQEDPVSPADPHQGTALVEYLRSWGYEVEELPRGSVISDSLLATYKYVIQVGHGGHDSTELAGYGRFVEREATLFLLSEHGGAGPFSDLTRSLGITFWGSVGGFVTRFSPHAITQGVGSIRYCDGAYVSFVDPNRLEILGWLNDNIPVMGVHKTTRAKVFFLGDTNCLQSVPQPLVDNLINWGFKGQ